MAIVRRRVTAAGDGAEEGHGCWEWGGGGSRLLGMGRRKVTAAGMGVEGGEGMMKVGGRVEGEDDEEE